MLQKNGFYGISALFWVPGFIDHFVNDNQLIKGGSQRRRSLQPTK